MDPGRETAQKDTVALYKGYRGSYLGFMKDGKCDGWGVFVSYSAPASAPASAPPSVRIGFKYAGEWHNDEMHGLGTYENPDGSIYVGEFRDGEKHGEDGRNFQPVSDYPLYLAYAPL